MRASLSLNAGVRLLLRFCSKKRLAGEYRTRPAGVFQPSDFPLCGTACVRLFRVKRLISLYVVAVLRPIVRHAALRSAISQLPVKMLSGYYDYKPLPALCQMFFRNFPKRRRGRPIFRTPDEASSIRRLIYTYCFSLFFLSAGLTIGQHAFIFLCGARDGVLPAAKNARALFAHHIISLRKAGLDLICPEFFVKRLRKARLPVRDDLSGARAARDECGRVACRRL